MGTEILGNTYKYIVDKSYGINKDGFIAIGSESIVYKGLKTTYDGSMQFSCVLKFKPKYIMFNGKVVNRLEKFKNEEWKIFDELRECRSIVRIDDVIENLENFSIPCDKINDKALIGEKYFCVVEEFIDGWSLEEFCREEYWKLRRIETLENGLSYIINYNEFSTSEKVAVYQSYNYDNILKYQNQILQFMSNLCDILEFVAEQKNILHLDIKPENIMVTRYGKELVLIDFGRSKKITKAERFVESELQKVNYAESENVNEMYQYGSLGYAAPECYSEAEEGSKFPFEINYKQGVMSIESDLFSFGTTFWECLNIFELVTKNSGFTKDTHDFYKENFLNDDIYCNRDLSCTSPFYHKKLENILRKCTRKRNKYYTDLNNTDYYHSYKELKTDIEDARDSAPPIVKEENLKAKNAFKFCGMMLSLFLIFLIIYFMYHNMAFAIAENKWNNIIVNYNDTQFSQLEEIANELIMTVPIGKENETYTNIAEFTYKDGDVSEYEAEMLVELLKIIDNKELLAERIDEIMKNGNARKFKEISTEVVKLGKVNDSIGYDLARAIFNVEVSKTEIVSAYEVLKEYYDNVEFRNAVIKLKNVLDNDENINIVAEGLGIERREVQGFLKEIVLEEMQ